MSARFQGNEIYIYSSATHGNYSGIEPAQSACPKLSDPASATDACLESTADEGTDTIKCETAAEEEENTGRDVSRAEYAADVISAGQNTDPATFLHELHHAVMLMDENMKEFTGIFNKVKDTKQFRAFLTKNMDILKYVLGKKDADGKFVRDSRGNYTLDETKLDALFKNGEKWTENDFEFEARLYEAYMRSGQTFNPTFTVFFRRVAETIRQMYRTLRNGFSSVKLNDEIFEYYDKLYGYDASTGKESTLNSDGIMHFLNDAIEKDSNSTGATTLEQEGITLDERGVLGWKTVRKYLWDKFGFIKGEPGEHLIHNKEQKTDYLLSKTNLSKMLSIKASNKSYVNGFSLTEHNVADLNVDTLFGKATLDDSGPDRNGSADLNAIERFKTDFTCDGDRNVYTALFTAKKHSDKETRDGLYSTELTEIKTAPSKGEENPNIVKLSHVRGFDQAGSSSQPDNNICENSDSVKLCRELNICRANESMSDSVESCAAEAPDEGKRGNIVSLPMEELKKPGLKVCGYNKSQNTLFQSVIPDDFSKRIDNISEKNTGERNSTLVFSKETPPVFCRSGSRNLSVEMYVDKHARTLFFEPSEKHGHNDSIKKDIVREVAENFANPIAIVKSVTADDPAVALYSIEDLHKHWVMVSIAPDKKQKHHETNLLTSVYGKKSDASYGKWISDGLLLYYDNEKTRELSVRLQLPSEAHLSENNVLTKSQLVNKKVCVHFDACKTDLTEKQHKYDNDGDPSGPDRKVRIPDDYGELCRRILETYGNSGLYIRAATESGNVYVYRENYIRCTADGLNSNLKSKLETEITDAEVFGREGFTVFILPERIVIDGDEFTGKIPAALMNGRLIELKNMNSIEYPHFKKQLKDGLSRADVVYIVRQKEKLTDKTTETDICSSVYRQTDKGSRYNGKIAVVSVRNEKPEIYEIKNGTQMLVPSFRLGGLPGPESIVESEDIYSNPGEP